MRRQRRHAPEDLPAICSARVANPDLAAFTVVIDAHDGHLRHQYEWEVAGVAQQPDAVPERGDDCLTVADERGQRWVVLGNWTGTL
jgi:hypothetical protein